MSNVFISLQLFAGQFVGKRLTYSGERFPVVLKSVFCCGIGLRGFTLNEFDGELNIRLGRLSVDESNDGLRRKLTDAIDILDARRPRPRP